MSDDLYTDITSQVGATLADIVKAHGISREHAAKGVVAVCVTLLSEAGEDISALFAEMEQSLRGNRHL